MRKEIVRVMILTGVMSMAGCRSAKPVAESHAAVDTVEAGMSSSGEESMDSVAIGEVAENMECEAIRFVEGGGTVAVDADGLLLLSGVAEVKASRRDAAAIRGVRKNLSARSKANDFITEIRQAETAFEYKAAESIASNGWRVKAGIMGCLLLFLIVIVIAKVRQHLYNH